MKTRLQKLLSERQRLVKEWANGKSVYFPQVIDDVQKKNIFKEVVVDKKVYLQCEDENISSWLLNGWDIIKRS